MVSVIKTIIVDYGAGEIGKSSAIKEVYEEIKRVYPNLIRLRPTRGGGDINALININGVIIGIESEGDPNSRMYDSLDNFLICKCDIIIATCRTKGDTIEKVRDFEKLHNYRLIYAQHYFNCSLSFKLNKLYAKSIVKIIDEIMTGNL